MCAHVTCANLLKATICKVPALVNERVLVRKFLQTNHYEQSCRMLLKSLIVVFVQCGQFLNNETQLIFYNAQLNYFWKFWQTIIPFLYIMPLTVTHRAMFTVVISGYFCSSAHHVQNIIIEDINGDLWDFNNIQGEVFIVMTKQIMGVNWCLDANDRVMFLNLCQRLTTCLKKLSLASNYMVHNDTRGPKHLSFLDSVPGSEVWKQFLITFLLIWYFELQVTNKSWAMNRCDNFLQCLSNPKLPTTQVPHWEQVIKGNNRRRDQFLCALPPTVWLFWKVFW